MNQITGFGGMIKTARFFIILVGLAIAAPAHAQDDAKLRNLLHLVGFDVFLGTIPSGIVQAIESVPNSKLDEAMKADIGELAMTHFDPGEIENSIVQSMTGALTDAQINELTDYFTNGPGKRITEMENAAQLQLNDAASMAEGRRILKQLTDTGDERIEVFERMIESMNIVEFGVAMSMNMSYAMLSGMMGSSQLPYSLSDEEILALINQQVGNIREGVSARAYSTMAFTYREMTTEDLSAYVTFLETEAAQKFYLRSLRGLQDALLPRVRVFGHELMVRMGVRKA